MQWYIIAIIAAVALLFVLVLLAARMCLAMVMSPKGQTTEQAIALEHENGLGYVFDDFDRAWVRQPFTVERAGITLRGEFIINPDDSYISDGEPRRRVVIICHGLTANRYAAVKYAQIFYRLGYSCVIYDERSFGESGGRYCTLGQEETKDLSEIIRLTRATFGERCLLGLHGESMGAATVLSVLASESPAFVVADCPFSQTLRLLREQMGTLVKMPAFPILNVAVLLARWTRGYDIKHFNPIDSVSAADVPICFIHGDSDTLINCAHSRRMYALCRDSRSELHLFKGANHAQSIVSDPEEYDRVVTRFVRKVTEPDVQGA